MIDEAFLPATLTVPPMNDQEFAAFCTEHRDLSFEMTAEGELLVMPPTFSLTGNRNREILYQLEHWARQEGRGAVGDSSTGFVLPNGARRSPDVSWTLKSAVRQLSLESQQGFWHLCPAFVIELRSKSDRVRVLREKMREYLENGAQLAWLIDPETRSVDVYRPGREPERFIGVDSIQGEGPVAGFELHLRTVWEPLGS